MDSCVDKHAGAVGIARLHHEINASPLNRLFNDLLNDVATGGSDMTPSRLLPSNKQIAAVPEHEVVLARNRVAVEDLRLILRWHVKLKGDWVREHLCVDMASTFEGMRFGDVLARV